MWLATPSASVSAIVSVPASRVALSVRAGGMSTVNVSSDALAGATLPAVSNTWLAFNPIVYVPLSALPQLPPGGVIWYVAVRGVPLPAGATETNVAF